MRRKVYTWEIENEKYHEHGGKGEFHDQRIKTVIYGRTAMILLGFLAQLVLLCVGYILLRNYSYLFYAFFLSVSAVAGGVYFLMRRAIRT